MRRHAIRTVWRSNGVPDDIIKEYRSPSKAWVAGVADPTGHLPEGHVFVSVGHKAKATPGSPAVKKDTAGSKGPLVNL